MIILATPRLILRMWTEHDIDSFYEINQDPEVIAFLPGSLTYSQATDFVLKMNHHQEIYGHSLWAVELKEEKKLIGFIGLQKSGLSIFNPSVVEIAWRLSSKFWGMGYATEGSQASLAYGWDKLGLNQIVAYTVPDNIRSIRVIQKLKMQRVTNGDFLHPKLPPDHHLSKHILYRIYSPISESATTDMI